MGVTASKPQLMVDAIEAHDLDFIKEQVRSLSLDEMKGLCQSLVPGNPNRCTIFHYATWQDNPQMLELLLDYVEDLEVRDGLGWTPLMTAVQRNSKENVKLLLKRGVTIDCDSVEGMDLLANAMHYNDTELVQVLIDHGAKVAGTLGNRNGCYLLHFAADDGLLDMATLLIERGKIPVDLLDQSGWSALHLAAGHNFVDIVKLLLKHGANINIKDAHDNTPLAWARQMNAKEAVDELESLGAVADEEWHGEPLVLSPRPGPREVDRGIDNSQFELDEEPSSADDKGLIILDALQRQR